MKIQTTPHEILEHGNWDAFCEMRGWNPWCVNEGLCDGDEAITLTVDEAKACGIYRETER